MSSTTALVSNKSINNDVTHASVTINDYLPQEMFICHIFTYFSPEELSEACKVCKHWNALRLISKISELILLRFFCLATA